MKKITEVHKYSRVGIGTIWQRRSGEYLVVRNRAEVADIAEGRRDAEHNGAAIKRSHLQ
jgi:hypothetical protein